jgi:hypothetical protein
MFLCPKKYSLILAAYKIHKKETMKFYFFLNKNKKGKKKIEKKNNSKN